jgi:hypothetical protein
MRNAIRCGTRGVALLGLLVASASTTPLRVEARPPEGAAGSEGSLSQRCCFANPRYAGTCEVTPAKEETCGTVLAYLNDPNSLGKTYCANTTIRGGWKSVSCAPRK